MSYKQTIDMTLAELSRKMDLLKWYEAREPLVRIFLDSTHEMMCGADGGCDLFDWEKVNPKP